MLKFYVKVFYLMDKVLTGELSCPVKGLVEKECMAASFRRPRKKLLRLTDTAVLDIVVTSSGVRIQPKTVYLIQIEL